MKQLDYYKSEKGIYVASHYIDYLNRRENISNVHFLINGKTPERTHHASWYFVPDEKELKTLAYETRGETCNIRYQRTERTPDPIKALIPEQFSVEDAHEWYCDEDYVYKIGSECEWYDYRNFYVKTWDTKEDYFKEQEIEVNYLGEIKSEWLGDPIEARYSVYKSGFNKSVEELDLKHIATYSELSEMMVPDLLIHNQPCSLTSEQTYEIIRKYINDNIDSRWAVVTSNFDFCFTVKKKIAVKPWIEITETLKSNGKSYSKPRLRQKEIDHKQVEIFEMTHNKKNYTGYTPIKGFSADSLQELKDTIDNYLGELITFINMPTSECECCGGTGVLFEDKFEVNKR